MPNLEGYHYLEFRPGSNLRQPFIQGRNIWVDVLYRHTLNSEPRNAQELAEDFVLPLQAVEEALDFCEKNQEFLVEERQRQLTAIKEHEKKHPPLMPTVQAVHESVPG